jgi:hypothetical protein
MKKQLIILIAVQCIGVTTAYAQDDAQLAKLILLTNSDSKSERVAGVELMGQYWDKCKSGSAGLSDIPTESSGSRGRLRVVSDEELDSIAASIETGIGDSDPDVCKAEAIALIGVPRSADSVLAAILAGIKSDDSTSQLVCNATIDRGVAAHQSRI